MKLSHSLLSIALLVSVAQLSADECGSCCNGRARNECAQECVQDEQGNCACDEKCGCNKPKEAVCEDCGEEVTEEGKCGCNKPKSPRVESEQEATVCENCGEEVTEKSCGCSSCGCSSCGCK